MNCFAGSYEYVRCSFSRKVMKLEHPVISPALFHVASFASFASFLFAFSFSIFPVILSTSAGASFQRYYGGQIQNPSERYRIRLSLNYKEWYSFFFRFLNPFVVSIKCVYRSVCTDISHEFRKYFVMELLARLALTGELNTLRWNNQIDNIIAKPKHKPPHPFTSS